MKKAIGFNLDTKAMQEYYPDSNWRKGYEDIRKFMTDNGFEWKQGSVYISKNNIQDKKVRTLVECMVQKNHG